MHVPILRYTIDVLYFIFNVCLEKSTSVSVEQNKNIKNRWVKHFNNIKHTAAAVHAYNMIRRRRRRYGLFPLNVKHFPIREFREYPMILFTRIIIKYSIYYVSIAFIQYEIIMYVKPTRKPAAWVAYSKSSFFTFDSTLIRPLAEFFFFFSLPGYQEDNLYFLVETLDHDDESKQSTFRLFRQRETDIFIDPSRRVSESRETRMESRILSKHQHI